MKFKRLSQYFSRLEETSSRLTMTQILAELFKEARGEEIGKICYLSLGRLAPGFAGIEFNLAEKMMIRAIAQAFEKKDEAVAALFKKIGDLGDVAFNLKAQSSKHVPEVIEVFDNLWEMAMDSGSGSVERKITKMAGLLQNLDPLSVKYVTRIPLGRLRLGFSDKTILDALSWMLDGGKGHRSQIEKAYNVLADPGEIATLIKSKGLRGLRGLRARIGTPIMPSLCQRLANPEEIIEKMGRVAIEPKYDGTRLQVHSGAGILKMFTRDLEDVTNMFPDLAEAVKKAVRANKVILDGEVIGFDPKTGKFLAFQETMKRKRKYEISQKAKEIPLKYFVFDILLKDDRDLISLPYSERREILKKAITPGEKILIVPQKITEDSINVRTYHQEQLKAGLEGIIAKKWQAPYEPGRTGFTWVKLKSEKGKKGAGLADSLEGVVMGFSSGRGKRADFGLGQFLVGIRDDLEGNFLTISKVGTGLTDERFREMYQRVKKAQVFQKPKEYAAHKNLTPDHWCIPQIVVEIEADNITLSSINTSGFGLRFPRLKRFRDDKKPDQVTTLSEVKKLFAMQK